MEELENTPIEGAGEALSIEDKMEATMSAAFDSATEEPSEPSEPSNRDERGRFKPKNPETAESAEEVTAAPEQNDQGDETEPAESATPTTRAPASWSPAAKAVFESADPVIQAEVLKREADINKALQQHADERKQFTGLQQVLGPRADMLAEEHGSVEQGITDLFKISDFAANQPEQFIQWFAQQRGLDLQKLTTGQPAEGGEPPNQLVNHLLQKVQSLERFATSFAEQQEQTQQRAANQQIEAFKESHPHFDAVRTRMGQLIQAGVTETLDEAYEIAVHADPAIRQKIIDDAKQAEIAELAKKNADAAARARRGMGTQLKANGSPSSVRAGPRSLEDTLSAAYDRATGA